MKKKQKLTAKQEAFLNEYLIDLNATAAAIRAGYSPRTAKTIAAQTMAKPYIKERLKEIMDKKDNERVASQDEVLEFLTDVMRGKVIEQIPLLDGDGYQKIKSLDATQPRDRIKAAELLGKRYALFTEKQQTDVTVGVTIIDDTGEDDE